MAAIGVDQKPRPLGVDGEGKMVGDRLVQVQLDRPAKGGGHVDAFGPVGHVGVLVHVRLLGGQMPLARSVRASQMRVNEAAARGTEWRARK